MRLNRHFTMELPADRNNYTQSSEVDRIFKHFAIWQARGGLLLLPPGGRLVEYSLPVPPAPPEGVSAEGAAWAEERLWIQG